MENKHCKNCGYLWEQHPDWTKDNTTYYVVRFMMKNDHPHPDCLCLDFYPMDNLEYLEYMERKSHE